MRAIVLREDKQVAVEDVALSDLPEGDVLVKVTYSTLNYKDALALTASAPIAKSYPMVPGIDFVGTVEESTSPDFANGETVVLNGWGVGEKHWGGLAEYARVKSKWLIRLPAGIAPQDAMSIGTAGYTAMLCCNALRDAGVAPDSGKIIVSGATGGVGSIAVAILAKRGYQVTALSGKPDQADYLTSLGAADIMERAAYADKARLLGCRCRGQSYAG
jgi:acrylyl-CoA reductase (NADPH)